VAVNQEYSTGGDSVQSGNIGDSSISSLKMTVTGPVDVAFDWKVSSQVDSDWLSFELEGIGVTERISGSTEWTTEKYSLGPGEFSLVWTYFKDESGCDLDDCGWIDNLVISPTALSLTSTTLEPCPQVLCETSFLMISTGLKNAVDTIGDGHRN
jgi:hypothetical protein